VSQDDPQFQMASQEPITSTACWCFYANTLDGHVAKELLQMKYPQVYFDFDEIFPTQPVFPLIQNGNYYIGDFDSIATCGVMIDSDDEKKVRSYGKPLLSFDHRMIISDGKLLGYLTAADVVNQSAFYRQFETSVILGVLREMAGPGPLENQTESIASYFYNH
jgi:hypothetical protein